MKGMWRARNRINNTPAYLLKGSMRNRAGNRWFHIGGKLMQIDSGPFGHVWGVNRRHQIWCRIGISWKNPKGRRWRRVPGGLKHVSFGQFGPWGVNSHNHIWFRQGVTRRNPAGKVFIVPQISEIYSMTFSYYMCYVTGLVALFLSSLKCCPHVLNVFKLIG